MQFNIPDGGIRVIFSDNLYADRVLIYDDNIEFENVYMDGHKLYGIVIGAENADNLNITTLDITTIAWTVNVGTGKNSLVTLKGRVSPVRVISNGTTLTEHSSYSDLGYGWFYDNYTLWVRLQHSSPEEVTVNYSEDIAHWYLSYSGSGYGTHSPGGDTAYSYIADGTGTVEWYQNSTIESRYNVENATVTAAWRIKNVDNLVFENVRVTITDPSGTEHTVKGWIGQSSTTSWTTINEDVDDIIDSSGTYRFSLKVEGSTDGSVDTITQWDNAQLEVDLYTNIGVDIQTGVDEGATTAFAVIVLMIVVMVFVFMIGIIRTL